MDPLQLHTYQMAERTISHILKWKETGNSPEWPAVAHLDLVTKAYWAQWDSLFLKEGGLRHRWESPELGKETRQLKLPTALRASVPKLLRDSSVGGQLGLSKTLGKVRQRFYWIHCRRDVEEWCYRCERSRNHPCSCTLQVNLWNALPSMYSGLCPRQSIVTNTF